MYAHRSSPSFSKVILRLFAVVSVIFMLYYGYSTFHHTDPLKERLYELGYPTQGYIVQNGTILWSDGHITIMQGAYVENYPITAEQAYNLVLQYLASYNEKLRKYGYRLYPEKKSLTEKEKNGQLYWVFELKLKAGSNDMFAGFAWVNRETGVIDISGLLG
uniref:T26-11p n=1 Tax=Thermococcus sp. 26/2 TaxID=758583 RepID=D6MY34_9EURY|nr:t26-11p [Thermococcus sp. 26/2]